jgi:mannose-6-phosphate isomerase-like protein (cupin superfamily)
MTGYISDILEETTLNENFRKVLYTGVHMQLVVMSLKPGEEIGEEVHDSVDQFFRIEEGIATAIINDEESVVVDDMVIVVPAGAKHNLINTGTETLKLYTIYSPANHHKGTIHATRADAMVARRGGTQEIDRVHDNKNG